MRKGDRAGGGAWPAGRFSVTDLSPAAHFAWHWRVAADCRRRLGNLPVGRFLMQLTIYIMGERQFAPTVTDLARVLSLPKATVSKYVGELLAADLVEEMFDRTDRRRKYLRLTKRGEAERATFLASSERALAQVLQHEAAHRARRENFVSPEHVVRVLRQAAGDRPRKPRLKAVRKTVPARGMRPATIGRGRLRTGRP
jgi:DNA-binding MarR family transcriptional regulator